MTCINSSKWDRNKSIRFMLHKNRSWITNNNVLITGLLEMEIMVAAVVLMMMTTTKKIFIRDIKMRVKKLQDVKTVTKTVIDAMYDEHMFRFYIRVLPKHVPPHALPLIVASQWECMLFGFKTKQKVPVQQPAILKQETDQDGERNIDTNEI